MLAKVICPSKLRTAELTAVVLRVSTKQPLEIFKLIG